MKPSSIPIHFAFLVALGTNCGKYDFVFNLHVQAFTYTSNKATFSTNPSPCFKRHHSPPKLPQFNDLKYPVYTWNRSKSKRYSTNTNDVRSTKSSNSSTSKSKNEPFKQYQHTLAVLTLPLTSSDRIANEAILNKAISCTQPSKTLSVILRCRDDDHSSNSHSLAALRRYVGEIYSAAWDNLTFGQPNNNDDSNNSNNDNNNDQNNNNNNNQDRTQDLMNIIVYPQNLPNTPPESWLHHRPDLECVCSHDSILGWHSIGSGETGLAHTNINGDGLGGLDAHVEAMNADRDQRGLKKVVAVHVDPWPAGASPSTLNPSEQSNDRVVFLEDEESSSTTSSSSSSSNLNKKNNDDDDGDDNEDSFLLNGPKLTNNSLFNRVAVGGTFDGMHYGHRKLLTLAISSLLPPPSPSHLLVGVTSDAMLHKKTLSNLIPPLEERMEQVQEFLNALAPGIKNQISIIPIEDQWGPPAYDGSFDALVLSDEVLETGLKLNQLRKEKGFKELTLLCTRRTEPNGMSSTALRKRRNTTSNMNDPNQISQNNEQ